MEASTHIACYAMVDKADNFACHQRRFSNTHAALSGEIDVPNPIRHSAPSSYTCMHRPNETWPEFMRRAFFAMQTIVGF
jgi:hypothetical protein